MDDKWQLPSDASDLGNLTVAPSLTAPQMAKLIARIDRSELLHSPNVIAEFVAKLTSGSRLIRGSPHIERRKTLRYHITTIVDVSLVDESFEPQGEIFRATLRNISASGISFEVPRPIKTKYLAIQLTAVEGEQMRLLLEVNRSRSTENACQIAGQFIHS